MPIRSSERHRYPKNWKQISARVRAEAGDHCEQCGARNGSFVRRGTTGGGIAVWRDAVAPAYENSRCAVSGNTLPDTSEDMCDFRLAVRIVLTVAHLDHHPDNCDRGNLRALCQRCHLAYDAQHHARNAAATRRARLASGDLFAGGGDE